MVQREKGSHPTGADGRRFIAVLNPGRTLGAPDATVVESAIESGWIDGFEPDSTDSVARFDLEPGERSVLALATERDHQRVLIDEESVREVARLLGLQQRWTLSVLFEALDRGALDFEGFLTHLERLVDHGFYLDEAVFLAAVRRARSITDD